MSSRPGPSAKVTHPVPIGHQVTLWHQLDPVPWSSAGPLPVRSILAVTLPAQAARILELPNQVGPRVAAWGASLQTTCASFPVTWLSCSGGSH